MEISEIDRSYEEGPFDIIGDIHGCSKELLELLEKLDYKIEKKDKIYVSHPEGRRLIFLGDLIDRGPDSLGVLRLVMDAVLDGMAFCVCGNHDDKLKRKLLGRDVKLLHGLKEIIEQLESENEDFKDSILLFLDKLAPYHIFDKGSLTIVHAGIKKEYIGKFSPRIKAYCLYGQPTGELDELGNPIRYPWAKDYQGKSLIVYGHTVVKEAVWINNTIDIDTGCVYGGEFTALRYPELELISVKAAKAYYQGENNPLINLRF